MALPRDHFRLSCNRAPLICLSTNFLKDRFLLLQIMLTINICYGRT
jgi:hypothetical protein